MWEHKKTKNETNKLRCISLKDIYVARRRNEIQSMAPYWELFQRTTFGKISSTSVGIVQQFH
jgi:hypothetical protein